MNKYIMRSTLYFISVITLCAMLFSCAKAEEQKPKDMELNALNEWIEAYAPDAEEIKEGVYYEVIKAADEGAEVITKNSWIEASYDIKDFDRNIHYTRNSDLAKRLGSFTKYTRYTPQTLYYPTSLTDSTMMIHAQYYALEKGMKVGEVVRIYSTSKHIFSGKGLKNLSGYGGQSQLSLEKNKPVIIDNFTVSNIIPYPAENPDTNERKAVEAVAESWGLNEYNMVKDREYFYIEHLKEYIVEDTIAVDEIAHIYYKARLIDGTLIDTNIDSVWMNTYGAKRKGTTSSLSGLIDDTTMISVKRHRKITVAENMPNKVFSLLMPEIHYGDSIRIVLTSRYAYEDKGRKGYILSGSSKPKYEYDKDFYKNGGYEFFGRFTYNDKDFYNNYNTPSGSIYPIPEVAPFTPLIFEFVVKPKHEPEE